MNLRSIDPEALKEFETLTQQVPELKQEKSQLELEIEENRRLRNQTLEQAKSIDRPRLVRRRMLKGQGLQKMARLGSQRRRENLQANSQTSKENTAEPREKKTQKVLNPIGLHDRSVSMNLFSLPFE